jgi:D-alanyl-D-alanine carboxypeptidase (penicillin-binding protein 5/6)
VEVADPIIAPSPQGSTGGALVLYDTIGELQRIPLLTAHEIERGGFFKRLWDTIRLFFHALKAKNKKNETALQRTNSQFTLV